MLRNFKHEGTEWMVWDTSPHAAGTAERRLSVATEFADGWLTFQSEAEKRRLAPVPSDWFDLPEAQLAALLERAAPVRRAPDMRF
jgi:hypothetical protein